MPMIGGGEPEYSVPDIWYSVSSAVPAPRMLPVWWKWGIGTAFDLNFTVGTAEAVAVAASIAAPRTARNIALRIDYLLCIDSQANYPASWTAMQSRRLS